MKHVIIVTVAIVSIGILGGVFLYDFFMNKTSVATEENSLNDAGISFTNIGLETSNSQRARARIRR